MSTFFHNPNTEDVRNGCIKLKNDIDSEYVNEVIKRYENERGDCSFIVCEKPTK